MSEIILHREEALALCRFYTDWHKSYIAGKREPLIQEAMKHTLLQRLFNKKARTREQAISYLKSGSAFNEYNIWSIYDWGVAGHVYPLLRALQHTDAITVKMPAFVVDAIINIRTKQGC